MFIAVAMSHRWNYPMVKACVIFEAIVFAETSQVQKRFVIAQAIVSSPAPLLVTMQIACLKLDEHMEKDAKPMRITASALTGILIVVPCLLDSTASSLSFC